MSTRKGWKEFEVVLTGAFLTGQPLQVRIAESSRMQRNLGEELMRHPGEGWGYQALEWQDAGGSYDGSGGYPSLVPLVLVRRDGDEFKQAVEQALARRPARERDWLDSMVEGWTWRLREISIDVFDFGTAIIKGIYDVQAPASLSVEETRRTVDLLSRLKPDAFEGIQPPIAAAYEEMTRATVVRFSEAVEATAAHARQPPWLTPMVAALGEPDEDSGRRYDWGRLLWLHPVYVLPAEPQANSEELHALARPFKSNFHRAAEGSYGLFVPGIEISVIVARGDPSGPRDTFMFLISLNWAYYALFMEIDRGLYATLDNDKWQTDATLGTLEADAAQMFQIYLRVQEVQARLSSVLMDIGGGALTLWDAIVGAQRFDELVAAVQGKVEILQRVAERRVQEAATVRARRTGSILGGLTALTVVTLAIAVVGSLVGSRSDAIGHIPLRMGTIALAAVAALVLLYFLQRDIAMRRGGRTRRGLGRRAGVPRQRS